MCAVGCSQRDGREQTEYNFGGEIKLDRTKKQENKTRQINLSSSQGVALLKFRQTEN